MDSSRKKKPEEGNSEDAKANCETEQFKRYAEQFKRYAEQLKVDQATLKNFSDAVQNTNTGKLENKNSAMNKFRIPAAESLRDEAKLPVGEPVDYEKIDTMMKVLCRQRGKICRVCVYNGNMIKCYSNRNEDDEQIHPNVDEQFYLLFQDGHFQPIIPDKVHAIFKGDYRNYCKIGFYG